MANNINQIESIIRSKMKSALIQAQEKVYQVIHSWVKEYYSEYSPSVYVRTYQFYKSLVKSEIRETANGYECEIYFDMEAMDYYMQSNKTANGSIVTFVNDSWGGKEVVDSASKGLHGGLNVGGTKVWDKKVINDEAKKALRDCLIANGITIR